MCEKLVKEIDSKHSLEEQKIIDNSKKAFESKEILYKSLIEKNLKKDNNSKNIVEEENTPVFIWEPLVWIFYRWGLVTYIHIDNYWITLEFDWSYNERIKIFIDWNHDISINESLLELKWQEIWIFRKQTEEEGNWKNILIKGIIVRNKKQDKWEDF